MLSADNQILTDRYETINRYKYNSLSRFIGRKELYGDFGLEWYAYGARMYNAQIARFPSLDPKADSFPHVSPYNYAENRPIDGIDLYGEQWASAQAMQSTASMIRGEAEQFSNYVDNQVESQQEIVEAYRDNVDVKISVGAQFGAEVLGNGIGVNLLSVDVYDSKNKDENIKVSQGVSWYVLSIEHSFEIDKKTKLQEKNTEKVEVSAGGGNVSYNIEKNEVDVNSSLSLKWACIIGIEISTKMPLKNK